MSFLSVLREQGIAAEEHTVLAPFTYFRIGGPADVFVRPKTNAELIAAVRLAQRMKIPITMLGGGGNVLIADRGIRGVVIHPENRQYRREGTTITAGAGVTNGQIISFSIQEGLIGLENLAGVPGTIGGSVYGNAGMFPQGIGPALEEVLALNSHGKEIRLKKEECEFGYRTSRFKRTKEIVVEARFALADMDPEEVARRVRSLIATHKRGVQPTAEPCSGCVFQNPEGKHAAQLIDDAGLKGRRIGGAEVSRLHANFIVNTGGATADHVVQLISMVKQRVRDRFGVQLSEEIQYLGFDTSGGRETEIRAPKQEGS